MLLYSLIKLFHGFSLPMWDHFCKSRRRHTLVFANNFIKDVEKIIFFLVLN